MHILVVEDSKFFAKAVETRLKLQFQASVCIANSRAEAQELLDKAPHCYDFALVDIILPDSDQGEVVDDVLSYEIPTIVFTGIVSPEFRRDIFKKPIIDYIIKNSPACLDYVVALIGRLSRNTETSVLVVDDSRSFRLHLRRLLERHRFNVHQACDAESALVKIKEDETIQLVIVDQNMPGLDGIELIKRIRKFRGMDHLAIIGMSSSTDADMSAQFIKCGANDYLPKNFMHEEFFCRVTQNLNMLDLLHQLTEAATTDFLTGLKNRNFFFDIGHQLFAAQRRDHISLTTAMLDLDHFKAINDTHGHDAGDMVLQKVAAALNGRTRTSDVIARIGGEEFALILVNMDAAHTRDYFEALRRDIEALEITCLDKRISVTCSIGVAGQGGENLEAALKEADELLYAAKLNGRNRVEYGAPAAGSAGQGQIAQIEKALAAPRAKGVAVLRN